MPPDGWRKCVKQLDLGFQLDVRKSEVPSFREVRRLAQPRRCEAAEQGAGMRVPAGVRVFHVGALKWIPPEPSGRLAHAALEARVSSLRRLRVGFCRRVDFIIVLFSLEHFTLIGSSRSPLLLGHLCRIFYKGQGGVLIPLPVALSTIF